MPQLVKLRSTSIELRNEKAAPAAPTENVDTQVAQMPSPQQQGTFFETMMAMMRAHAKVMDQQNHQCRITLSPNKQSGQSSTRLALGMGADQKKGSGSSTDLPLANEAKEADDLPKSVNANKDKSARPSKSLEEFEKEAFDALAKKKAAKARHLVAKGHASKVF